MGRLDEALEGARPAIEAALAEAEGELAVLLARQRELEALIARARAALGDGTALASTSQEGRLTLHEAIARILRENDNNWMTVTEVAMAVNERGLYKKRDGSRVEPNQIHARAKNYASLFEKKGSQVRLRDAAEPSARR